MRRLRPGIIAFPDASAARFCGGQGCEHRKQWIEIRLKDLVGVFAVECAGFAVLDNHEVPSGKSRLPDHIDPLVGYLKFSRKPISFFINFGYASIGWFDD
jgi:hypothetical protein